MFLFNGDATCFAWITWYSHPVRERIMLACAWQGWIVKRTTMISWTGDCPSVQLDLKMLRKNSRVILQSFSKQMETFVSLRSRYQVDRKYFPAIYFYNNISTNVNLTDNNFGEIVSLIISPMFFNLDHKNYYSVVRIINTVTILDSIIMIRCEVLHNQTDIVRMVNSSRTNCSHTHRSFFWSIFTRKSMKDTPKNTSNVIVKSETKKSIRNQGDGSIFHNHCNIECIMQYRI